MSSPPQAGASIRRMSCAGRRACRQAERIEPTKRQISARLLIKLVALALCCAPAVLSLGDSFNAPLPHRISVRSEFATLGGAIGRDDGPRTVGLAYELPLASNIYAAAEEDEDDDDAIAAAGPHAGRRLALRNELYLLEDKDYPKSLFEDYPQRVGQVSGVTTLPSNDVVILHRSQRQWTADSFNESTMRLREAQPEEALIGNDTIMILDREDGGSVASFGANLFYLPHSIASDAAGNLWVSDVGRHQVMRLPSASVREALLSSPQGAEEARNKSTASSSDSQRQIWPDIILGEAFVPGADQSHFCQPSEIAVSSNGRLVFVADGYCNQRVLVFTGAGQFLASLGQQHNLTVVHSLALIEERNLLCVADRENARILCYHAGLDGDLSRLGELVRYVDYPLGRVFAISSLSEDHLLVSSNQVGTNRYDLAILNPFTNELKLVWISTDLLEPHSLASTRDRQAAYAADISKDAYKKVFKFNIITRRD